MLPPAVARVLEGLARNREPGWNFPGHFLDLSFDTVDQAAAELSLRAEPHLRDAAGEISLGPLAVLTDIALAATMRQQVGLDTRMATVAMGVQFTGATRRGDLRTRGRFDGFVADADGRIGQARTEIFAGDALVATATATFMAIAAQPGTAPLPMRPRHARPPAPALTAADLTPHERAAYDRAMAVAEAAPASFIDAFWGLTPRRTDAGSLCECPNGLHVGNRVGHMQGGISFALAATAAQAALGPDWRTTGISAWFLRPGTGAMLRGEGRIVHQGRSTAVAGAQVLDADGRLVIEAVTQHARVRLPDPASAMAG